MANSYGRQVVLTLTNKSGGGVVAGDVVIVDTGNDGAFTTTTTGASQVSVGVVQETIANNASGRVLVAGYAALINVPASVTRGHFIKTHTVAKQATGNSTRQAGSFGQFLTGGTTPTGWLWGFPDNAGAAGESVATSTIWDAKGDIVAATAADTGSRLAVGTNGYILTADSAQSTGLKWAPVAAGQSLALMQPGLSPVGSGASTNNTAQLGWACPIVVPAPMKVRGMSILVSSAGSGSIQWGLFDYSASASSATKLAGGSAAPGGTGYRSIAASGAPVSVAPGAYIMVFQNPAANQSTIGVFVSGTAPPWNQVFTTYTWTDTPDFTSASWVANTTMPMVYLEGDLDGSNNRWT